ncbi:VOC family protein [uncultured Tenacibaculum sp.]|uniref:VOC family protein n=1 Tax=uncultured Tenacibaculum sp. TaxID=174713 RepID=UPI0026043B4A|nr:VOC family protein [uncultured Tenacibaculum sp.]
MSANFHLSLPCKDVATTKTFYTEVFNVELGRNTNSWLDINLFGNQITFTKSGEFNFEFKNYRLDEHILPSFHFGIILDIDEFGKLYGKLLQMDIGVTIETTFMKGNVGEHLSFFVKDPNGYMIEFKSFKEKSSIFKS